MFHNYNILITGCGRVEPFTFARLAAVNCTRIKDVYVYTSTDLCP